MTTNLPVLRADRLPAVRPRCALDVRTPALPERVQAAPRRGRLSPAEWFFIFAIVFFTGGALASSIL